MCEPGGDASFSSTSNTQLPQRAASRRKEEESETFIKKKWPPPQHAFLKELRLTVIVTFWQTNNNQPLCTLSGLKEGRVWMFFFFSSGIFISIDGRILAQKSLCPLDIVICPYVHWTYGQITMLSGVWKTEPGFYADEKWSFQEEDPQTSCMTPAPAALTTTLWFRIKCKADICLWIVHKAGPDEQRAARWQKYHFSLSALKSLYVREMMMMKLQEMFFFFSSTEDIKHRGEKELMDE